MRPREGDFIETHEGLIFDVKGYWHPPNRITAFLRYVPHPRGERERKGTRYRKIYDMGKRQTYLEAHFPRFLFYDRTMGPIQAVPENDIARIYRPQEFLASLEKRRRIRLEDASLAFCTVLSRISGVPLSRMGVSGSLLVGLASSRSDIDIVVYGKKEGRSVYAALTRLRNRGTVQALSGNHLTDVAVARWGHADEKTRQREAHKLLHGLFRGFPYFVRLVWRESLKDFRPAGMALVEGTVTGARDSIFTPCVYGVESAQVQNLYSVRGRYCEHMRRGERFTVMTKIEKGKEGERRAILSGEAVTIVPHGEGKPFKR